MPSTSSQSSSSKHVNNLQNQFMIKSSTPVLNDRCLSPINRLDLATSKEQLEHLEDLCRNEKSFQSINSNYANQFNYFNGQFNQSPNSNCSTPNRSLRSFSSNSQNNSLPKSGNYLRESLFNNLHNMQFKRSASVSKSNDHLNDQISLSDQTNYHSYLRRMESSTSNLNNTNSNSNFQPFLPSQTNSFTSLSLSTNSSSVFGGSIRDLIVRSRPVSFSFSTNNNNRNTIFGRLPFSWFKRVSSRSAPELGD